MDIRQVTDLYHTSAQLEPSDMQTLADQGITTVICNRPDAEVPPPIQAAAMQQAAEAAGLTFVFNPVGGALSLPIIEEQSEAIDAAEGPVVAYCNSGARSTIVWALGVAGEMEIDEILSRARAAGQSLDWLRPNLEALALQKSKG
ncbi:Sulfide-quinone reductase [Roseibacterium elongatum DSM 19469]|uniref:Sulfide-quinone reductase n=1 Tax=Roseicyclus elongatus DSM 19469 TaxID=1294273 RepID=W8SSN9_9RHOB|nr:TIGR01244 family sulfur transferase [Roseibacterium elongatum]AHM05530.1 Sulfide-quinone reductase [Roseibacterium elongatum DSM 19469]